MRGVFKNPSGGVAVISNTSCSDGGITESITTNFFSYLLQSIPNQNNFRIGEAFRYMKNNIPFNLKSIYVLSLSGQCLSGAKLLLLLM